MVYGEFEFNERQSKMSGFVTSVAPVADAAESTALIEHMLELLRQEDSFQKLANWLPAALVNWFALRGCQIELYDHERQQTQLIGGVGEGWSKSTDKIRSVKPHWELYKSLIQGVSLQFSSRWFGQKNITETALTWLGYPVTNQTTLLGTIWMIRSAQCVFSGAELRQLHQLSNYVAIALHQFQLEQRLDQQQTEIHQLRKAKDEFLQLISHELFVPLGSIQLSAQTLERIFKDTSWRKVPQRSTVLKVLSLLSQECRRQKQFVDNLITLMFPEHQKASEPMLMNLSDWLPSLLRTFTARFEQESLQLSTTIPQDPLLIECDVTHLERVITELITNAIKYTPAKKTVKITVKATDTRVKIEIANTGVQIPLSDQPHIFEKFYRVPELDQRHYGGSGLGLALTKQLVANLDGTIEMKSTKQKTMFTVELPR